MEKLTILVLSNRKLFWVFILTTSCFLLLQKCGLFSKPSQDGKRNPTQEDLLNLFFRTQSPVWVFICFSFSPCRSLINLWPYLCLHIIRLWCYLRLPHFSLCFSLPYHPLSVSFFHVSYWFDPPSTNSLPSWAAQLAYNTVKCQVPLGKQDWRARRDTSVLVCRLFHLPSALMSRSSSACLAHLLFYSSVCLPNPLKCWFP